jgi:hypothetical protein
MKPKDVYTFFQKCRVNNVVITSWSKVSKVWTTKLLFSVYNNNQVPSVVAINP